VPNFPKCSTGRASRRGFASRRLELCGARLLGLKTVVPGPTTSWAGGSKGRPEGQVLRFHFEGPDVALHLSQVGASTSRILRRRPSHAARCPLQLRRPALLARARARHPTKGWVVVLASGDEGPWANSAPRSPTRRSTTCWPKVMTTATSHRAARPAFRGRRRRATPTTPSTAPGSRRSPPAVVERLPASRAPLAVRS